VAFDPYLYVAFVAGLAAGRLVRRRSPWVGRAAFGTVCVLIGLLGATLAGVSGRSLIATLPLALGFVALVLAVTVAFTLALGGRRASAAAPAPGPGAGARIPLPAVLLACLVIGFVSGRTVSFPYGEALRGALYVLLALVGFGLELRLSGLRRAWVPIASAAGGAVVAAGVFVLVTGIPAPDALASSLAFGWYTLAGPLVAERAGPMLGLLAFLTNFLREDLTMLLSPVVGRRLGGEGIAAMGGATSMDTTLYFATRFGGDDAGSIALASGLVLTVAASLILPAILAA